MKTPHRRRPQRRPAKAERLPARGALPGSVAFLLAGLYGGVHAATPSHADTPSASIDVVADAGALVLRPSFTLSSPPPPLPIGTSFGAVPPRAASALPAGAGATPLPRAGEFLLLDVVVNGQPLADVAAAESTPAGELLLARGAWREARFVDAPVRQLSDGSEAHALDALPGARYTLDRARLRLDIEAGAGAFLATRVGETAAPVTPRRPDPGLLLNYDAAITHQPHGNDAGAVLDLVAFGSAGSVSTSALASTANVRKFVRLDTHWRYDMPERMETLVVGDTIGSGGAWSRPVRFGGVRWARNFALRPGFVTFPQFTLQGEAALPSTVDVLVNESSRLGQRVQPGPFSVTNVPVVTGAGEVSLVVRDLLGREQVLTQDYYATPQILAPGLVDFSFEAGRLREGWGERSAYGDGFGAATVRYGWTPSLTGEARVELQPGRRAAGVELASLLGTWATGRIAVAGSDHPAAGPRPGERGLQWTGALERSTRAGGAFVRYERADAGFAPFGEADDPLARDRRVRDQLQVGGSRMLGSVSVGGSLIRQRRWSGDDFRLAAGTLSLPVPGGGALSVSVARRFAGGGSWDAMVMLGLPLENGVFTAAHAGRNTTGSLEAGVLASSSPPAGPGTGWRVEASTQRGQESRAAWMVNTSAFESSAEVAASAGAVSTRAAVRGSVGVINQVPFATRPVNDNSFAMVDTGGVAGLPIYLSHQVVGHTGPDGRAFVPNLLPWQANRLQVDPADLPLDVQADPAALEQVVSPFARGGNVVRFPMRRVRQALVVLQGPDGTPLAQGEKVVVAGREHVAARRGEVWLDELPANGDVRIAWMNGRCAQVLRLPAATDASPARVGPLACGKEGRTP